MKLDSKDEESWLELVTIYIFDKNYAESIRAAQESLNINDKKPRAWGALAVAQGDSGHKDEASNALLRTMDLDPENIAWSFTLGGLYYQDGKLEEAKKNLERVVKLDPEFTVAWDFLAKVYIALGDSTHAAIAQLKAREKI